MEFSADHHSSAEDIINLFEAVFSASEGAEEGRLIGALSRALIETTPKDDIFVFSASKDGCLAGCAVFTRLRFESDERVAFILSPMAVASRFQASGVGTALLTHGLNALRDRGVDIAVTYGDPNYYKRVGYSPITEAVIQAPLTLTQPEGWLAQSLTERPLDVVEGKSRCVDALMRPEYW